jgi:hypothetical protein
VYDYAADHVVKRQRKIATILSLRPLPNAPLDHPDAFLGLIVLDC